MSHAVLYGVETDSEPKSKEFFVEYFYSKVELITYRYLRERKAALMKESARADCPKKMRKEEVIADLINATCQLSSLKELISYMVVNVPGSEQKEFRQNFFEKAAKEEVSRQVTARYSSYVDFTFKAC